MELNQQLIESLVKTVGAIIGTATAGYQAYRLGLRGFRGRAVLKRDLEILKTLDPNSRGHAVLKAHIDRLIESLYAPPPPPLHRRLAPYIPKPKEVGVFFFGLAMFVFFALWTAWINMDGFSWWSILTGFFALSGFGAMMGSFQERPQKPEEQTVTARP